MSVRLPKCGSRMNAELGNSYDVLDIGSAPPPCTVFFDIVEEGAAAWV